MAVTRRIVGRLAATARGAGVAALAANIPVPFTAAYEVEVTVNAASVFNQVWMGATLALNLGAPLIADRSYTFTVLCAAGDTLNFNCTGAVTYTKFVVHELTGDI